MGQALSAEEKSALGGDGSSTHHAPKVCKPAYISSPYLSSPYLIDTMDGSSTHHAPKVSPL